jgi:hypothetical protein
MMFLHGYGKTIMQCMLNVLTRSEILTTFCGTRVCLYKLNENDKIRATYPNSMLIDRYWVVVSR